MANARIAVLFDAENINCETALRALARLNSLGNVQIKRAVGDFSASGLANWIGCARENGIELVLQPSLGKGKNGADIKLTIEAMDIVHQRSVNAVALVTRDRDFTPLALRLREAGLSVLGFAQTAPSPAFAAACLRFEVIGAAADVTQKPVQAPKPTPSVAAIAMKLDDGEKARLRRIVIAASKGGSVMLSTLKTAIEADAADLAPRLSGKGKFLKTLVAHGLVERVGNGPRLMVRTPHLQKAG